MLTHLWNDFRYAARRLSGSPGFTAAAVATIAIGVGINTAIFSVLNGLALRELPAPDAGELVSVYQTLEGVGRRVEGSRSSFSVAEYEAYRDGCRNAVGPRRLLAFDDRNARRRIAAGDLRRSRQLQLFRRASSAAGARQRIRAERLRLERRGPDRRSGARSLDVGVRCRSCDRRPRGRPEPAELHGRRRRGRRHARCRLRGSVVLRDVRVAAAAGRQ